MYAIIRAGGKQAKVQSGDVIDIERVKGDSEELSFAPLLVVDDKGTAVSDRSVLANATVTAKVLGESQGPKIDIYKYKNKTGYSRRQGHRQKYTRIEITGIVLPGAAKPKAKAAAEKTESAESAAPETAQPAAKAAAKPAKAATPKPEAKPAAKAAAKPAQAATPKPEAKPAAKAATPKPAAAKGPSKPKTTKPPAPEEE
jgi:large subunit ribosomal protein L21